MSWISVAVAGTSATVNYLNNQAAKKREANNMMANAEAMRYSPWSGMKPQMMSKSAGTSDLGAIGTGALQGAMFAKQFGKGSAPDATPDASMPNPGANSSPLGGQQMAQQLGQQGSNFEASMPKASPPPQAPMPNQGQAPQAYADSGQQPPQGNPWSVLNNKKLTFYSNK